MITPGFTNTLHTNSALHEGSLEIPYGRYPHIAGLQILDRTAADEMQQRFRALNSRLARRFRGLPIYIGHPDASPEVGGDAGSQNLDTRSYGWITGIEPGPNSVRLQVKWTPQGKELIADEQFAYFSPHWGMLPAQGEPRQNNAWRPVEMYSLGLTNTPNIPGLALGANTLVLAAAGGPDDFSSNLNNQINTNYQPMKPLLSQLLQRLGQHVPDDADDTQLTIALESVVPLLDSAENLAANSATAAAEIARLRAELADHTKTRRDDELEAAINDGRITRANRDQWDKNLQSDFDGNRKLLRSLKPAWNGSPSGGNSTGNPANSNPVAPGKSLANRRNEACPTTDDRVRNIAQAVARKQTVAGIKDYDQAFRAIRKEQPELFT